MAISALLAPTPVLMAPIAAPSLALRIADSLTDAVASGAVEPGERLVETDIAARLGVSRVPLREALKLLEAQGIVEVVAHRGARVVPFDDARIDRICEARVALERLALGTAVQRYAEEPALLGTLDQLIEAMRTCQRRRDLLDASKADLAFHQAMVAHSGNDVVAKLWEALARHVLIVFGREARSERGAPALVDQHRALRDVLASGDLVAATRELETHILRLRGSRAAGQTERRSRARGLERKKSRDLPAAVGLAAKDIKTGLDAGRQ